jgi:site-specific DNA recombinase
MTICASYERVSTRVQGQTGFSLGAQHASLEAFAETNGWTLPEHLRFRDGEDVNASGTRWDLPGLLGMLEAAQRREFEILVVPDFDRFARNMTKGKVLEEQLKSYGVRVVFQRVPVEDTPEGRLQSNMFYAWAEYDRERIRLRTMMGRRAKAQMGKVVGHRAAPYGYRFTYEALPNGKERVCGLEPDPVSAPTVERIFAELRTRSAADIAGALNADGIAGPQGNRWSPHAVHAIANNTVYRGVWLYGKHHRRIAVDDPSVIPVAVPAIVTAETWEAIQRSLAHRRTARRGRIPRETDPYLLRGMLTCGHCGGMLHTHPNGGRYYRCGCRWPSRAAQRGKAVCVLADVHAVDLEAELWRIVEVTLLDPAYLMAGLDAGVAHHQEADRIRGDRMATIDRELIKARAHMTNLVDKLAEGGIFGDAVRSKADELERTITGLERQKHELSEAPSAGLSPEDATAIQAFASEIRAGLAHATTAERRTLIELLDIRAAVFLADDGVKLGRKYRFRIEWAARIPLGDSVSPLNNWVVHKISDASVVSTLKESVSGIDDSLWTRLPGLAPGQAIVSFTQMQRPVLTAIDPTPAKLRMVD